MSHQIDNKLGIFDKPVFKRKYHALVCEIEMFTEFYKLWRLK